MAKERVITAIDIGSTRVRTVVGVMGADDTKVPQIVGVGDIASHGIRKGQIIDIEETINSIAESVSEAERMAGTPIDHAIVNMGGTGLNTITSRGFISISRQDGEINSDDIQRVLEAAQAVSIPQNQKIIKVIPKSFTVDDQIGIKDPVGMTGVRLEVDAMIITAPQAAMRNISKCIHQVGIDVDDFVPSMLASSEAVLSRREKELGVAVVDIGGGSVNIAVFEEGALLHTAVLAVGAGHVTNDIAIGLRTSVDTAEKIKLEYGTCLPSEVRGNEAIDLSLLSHVDTHQVSRQLLAEIAEARMQEIFDLVAMELSKINRDGLLPAGIVLTGGGVKIPGCVEVAKQALNLPVQVGYPVEVEGVVDNIDDPAYATVIGLLLWGIRHEPQIKLHKTPLFGAVKDWLKNFIG
ncbi:MAG: cell division protein FtsA [Candidatus Abawacabacteria bacterium RBG_16_42_10]|uniref:Cell division protein FtsA n=1 Tax=Candidatus Abawacabacteria bacterium RBG_16_42_10 TaxID=1817814 RepID=A0A1F4XL65_9BACT|nr:MAG: cell division protein FtsA [Candidatus Abawacabacteria bacterium RBG_16_42_10]